MSELITCEPQVTVLKCGYGRYNKISNSFEVECTCTLIRDGERIIIVDPLGAWSTAELLKLLNENQVKIEDITDVIGTHGHSDHIGNLNCFSKAQHIVCYDINNGCDYIESPLNNNEPYHVTSHSRVIPTPGHSGQDISLIVKNARFQDKINQTVAIVGDIFECESDENIWRYLSYNPDLQEISRNTIREIADVIVPGHGPAFFTNLKQ